MTQSAGLLVFKRSGDGVEVLLTHPGGPFWAKKDTWSIPKGELDEGETLEQALQREFTEETGFDLPAGKRIDLGSAKQGGGKTNFIWAVEGDANIAKFVCKSTFTIEWPPKSGRQQEFPENDRAAWFDIATARQKVFPAQVIFLDRLAEQLKIKLAEPPIQHRYCKR